MACRFLHSLAVASDRINAAYWYPVQTVSKCVSYVRVTFKVNLKLMPAGMINCII